MELILMLIALCAEGCDIKPVDVTGSPRVVHVWTGNIATDFYILSLQCGRVDVDGREYCWLVDMKPPGSQ